MPRIPLDQIEAATENFSEGNELGSGGFGNVYRGTGPDGTLWAVKRAKSVTEKSFSIFEKEVFF